MIRIQVVDPDSGRIEAEIADTPAVHGVAIASGLGKGYTSNGRDNSVTVVDIKTLKSLSKVKKVGGDNPDFIAYDAVTRRVFAFNGRSHNASVIDTASDTLVATIELGGKPEAAVADGKARVFVDIEDKHDLSAIYADKGGDHFRLQQTVVTQAGARTMAFNPMTHEIYLVTAEFEEAPVVEGQPGGRRTMKPGSFTLLVLQPR